MRRQSYERVKPGTRPGLLHLPRTRSGASPDAIRCALRVQETSMGVFSNPFRRRSEGLPPWAALDQETLRISAAMEHVQQHGNLDAFPGGQNEKLALMLTASRQGLVTWNREHQRYELTGLGRERLGLRRALQDAGAPASAPVRPAPAPAPAATAAAPAGRAFALGSGT